MAKQPKNDKREYLRLDSVFPVEFQILLDNRLQDFGWQHCFTHNISKGGICLEIPRLEQQVVTLLNSPGEIRFNLRIHIPIHMPPTNAAAKVLWFKKEEGHHLSQYRVGLKYDNIDAAALGRIMRFAYTKVNLPRLALAIIAVLFLGFAFTTYNNFRLVSANKKLIKQMLETLAIARVSKDELQAIQKERAVLEAKLLESSAVISAREEELNKMLAELKTIEEDNTELLKEKESQIQELKAMLAALKQTKSGFIQKLGDLGQKEELAALRLNKIKEKKIVLEKASFEKMYQWVKLHQNPRTGLISSFEGDRELSDVAFTYDQALAIIAFSYHQEYELAGKALDFYLNKARRGEGFYNGYYVSTGEPAEFTVHSGPNLWLGIAALQYTKLSGDNKYITIAKDIARWMLLLQNEEALGGLRGGPDISWYSTEHNLDGFAFFGFVYRITREPLYRKAAEEILAWLKANAYDSPLVPVKRGRGDATIATDTYAWSIASLGPGRLVEMGMDPEAILKFAEDNCSVQVEYQRPEGESIPVKGFDFAKQAHLARGGVISSEWTAQMVLAYKILSRYFGSNLDKAKEEAYQNKADEYLEELTKMIIASPSSTGQGQGCLPYASSDFVDTGHGWMTPKGKNTGSLSATVYALLAYYGFNPLEIADNSL